MDVVGVVEVVRVPYKPSPANRLVMFLVNISKILVHILYSLLRLLGNHSESVNRASQTLKRRSDWQQAPHPRVRKSVLPVGRARAQPAIRSFTLFWGGEWNPLGC